MRPITLPKNEVYELDRPVRAVKFMYLKHGRPTIALYPADLDTCPPGDKISDTPIDKNAAGVVDCG